MDKILRCFLLLLLVVGANSKDPYKVLGVDRNASQHDIKKAFHKLSLKYHPDKNPSKSAQAKMADLTNAYEVLSNEEKRKNFDLTGDESGRPAPEANFQGGGFGGYNAGHRGQHGRSGGPRGGYQRSYYHDFQEVPDMGQYFTHYTYQSAKKREGSQASDNSGWTGFNFPFEFGSPYIPSGGMFGSLFGSAGKKFQNYRNTFGGFGGGESEFGSRRQREPVQFSKLVVQLDTGTFQKNVIENEEDIWLVLFSFPVNTLDMDEKTMVLNRVAEDLSGMIQVGVVNCKVNAKLCRDQAPTLQPGFPSLQFFTSFEKSTPFQYTGIWTDKTVKDFCVRKIPNFSTRLDDQKIVQLWKKLQEVPQAILFTKKKETPALWRALSGAFKTSIKFYEVQVDSTMNLEVSKQFGIKSFPAVVGLLGNGEDYMLASEKIFALSGNKMVKEMKSFLDELERKSKAAGVSRKGSEAEDGVPLLTKANSAVVCGSNTPLCVIAVVNSKKAQEKAKEILSELSHKTLIRKVSSYEGQHPALSYCLVDASQQSSFIRAFKGVKVSGSNVVLIAYKPRRSKYTTYKGQLTLEDVERFVGSVLGGDTSLQTLSKEPVLS